MNRRAWWALGRLEIRAAGPLLAAWTAGYLLLVGFISQQTAEAASIMVPIWALAGLLAGAGLVARDRRLRTAPLIGALPVRPAAVVLARLLLRVALVLLSCGAALAGQAAWNLRWPAGAEAIRSGDVRAGLLLAVSGLLLAAIFSAVSPRESHAFGGGFLALAAWGAVWLGLILVHPLGSILYEIAFPPALAAAVVLLLLAPLALIRAVRSRDPVSPTERWRILGPLSAAMLLIGLVYCAWPYVQLAMPLASYHGLSRLVPVPDGPDLLAQAVKRGPRMDHQLGLWRIGPEGTRQVAHPALYAWSASPGGRSLACHRMARRPWQRGGRIELLRMEGGRIRLHETQGLVFWQGIWSPDGDTYAFRSSYSRETNAIEILPVDPGRAAVVWTPPDASLQNRRQLYLAGWLDATRMLCIDIRMDPGGWPSSTSPARLWLLTVDGQARSTWQGNLGPGVPYTWPAYVSRARGTLLVKRRDSESQNRPARLLEIDPIAGRELRHWPIDPLGSVSLDRTGRRALWTQLGPRGPEIRRLDLETGEVRSLAVPRVEEPRLSPDGRHLATRVVEGPHRGSVLLASWEEDRFDLHLEEAWDLAWTGDGRLAVLREDRRLLSLDPGGGGVTTLWTGRGAGGAS